MIFACILPIWTYVTHHGVRVFANLRKAAKVASACDDKNCKEKDYGGIDYNFKTV
jgi:hypothetical protein